MNWYKVELHYQDPYDSRMISQVNRFQVMKTTVTVEADDKDGAIDEALFRYAHYYGATRRKPQVYKVDQITDFEQV